MAKAAMKNVAREHGVTGEENPLPSIGTTIEGETTLIQRAETGDNAKSKGRVIAVKNVLTEFSEDLKAQQAERIQLVQNVTQRLSEAAELFNEGTGRQNEAKAIADAEAIRLYRARAYKTFSDEQVSAVLRNVFGAKRKGGGAAVREGDPEASKTPAGMGEDIRKRIVRASRAYFAAVGDYDAAGPFFEGLTADSADKEGQTLQDVIDGLESGGSIWTAYEAFAAIKRNHTEKLAIAFDPAKISAIVEGLAGDNAFDVVLNNADLKAAYVALQEALNVVFSVEVPEED